MWMYVFMCVCVYIYIYIYITYNQPLVYTSYPIKLIGVWAIYTVLCNCMYNTILDLPCHHEYKVVHIHNQDSNIEHLEKGD